VPESSAFEVELAIEKLKSHKSQGIDEIPAEMFMVFAMRSINLLFIFGIWRNCLRNGRSRPLYLSIRRIIKQIVIIIGHIIFGNYVQNFIQHPVFKLKSICRGNYLGSTMWIPTQQINQ